MPAIPTLRICKQCNFVGECDETQPRKTKAYGWMGNLCWRCYCADSLARKLWADRKGKDLQRAWHGEARL